MNKPELKTYTVSITFDDPKYTTFLSRDRSRKRMNRVLKVTAVHEIIAAKIAGRRILSNEQFYRPRLLNIQTVDLAGNEANFDLEWCWAFQDKEEEKFKAKCKKATSY